MTLLSWKYQWQRPITIASTISGSVSTDCSHLVRFPMPPSQIVQTEAAMQTQTCWASSKLPHWGHAVESDSFPHIPLEVLVKNQRNGKGGGGVAVQPSYGCPVND